MPHLSPTPPPATGRAAVFLDRDGVLNRTTVRDGTPYPPATVADLEILPGVADACAMLADAGLPLIVVTNQPDVARGTQTRDAVQAINHAVQRALPLAAVYCCFHDNGDGCLCRKPKPGMLLDAARELGVSLSDSFMVGDRWGDIAAGRAAGCRTFLVDRPYSQSNRCEPDARVADLLEAARVILRWVEARQAPGIATPARPSMTGPDGGRPRSETA